MDGASAYVDCNINFEFGFDQVDWVVFDVLLSSWDKKKQ